MEQFFAYQKDSRTPCKYGRKCFQKSKEHLDKYKHPPTKDDIKIDTKKTTRKRDSKGKVKFNNGESSSVNHRNDSHIENQGSHDMEVPEQSNTTVNNVANETGGNNFINEQHNSTEYVIPSARLRTQQQQQLLLTNTTLEDCSGDDSIVPCTPTLFTPRRLDGETISSPHVPSSFQAPQFTFIGESQISDVNEELSDPDDTELNEVTVLSATDVVSWNAQISKLFLVGEMPKEFYELWTFCKKLCPAHPEDAFLPVGLKLVGPYDVLAGHMNAFDPKYLEKGFLHWRYYYDPPEFQTIIASTNSQFHIGYYRDQPLEDPVYIVSNDPEKNCIIESLGLSVFSVLRKYFDKFKEDVALSISKKLISVETRGLLNILKGRKVKPVAKTFHRFGVVVPYDKKTDVGYRPLSESERTLQRILKSYREANESKKFDKRDKLQTIINYANIACDECDFGTGLELGIDIFCDGNPELHGICKQLLVTVYNLLRRPQFGTIIKLDVLPKQPSICDIN
ncbi:Hypothetical protein CINCED_3A005986 [Cinara cedri]|uniref:PBZ-type domain-containing protein n=1 Tax=Cinara cedri TaxID=506608 RepID=A0A5E4NGY9_9HEMI|nr:Hypothetical protein CINCED_3A005986 [Cinara cedri]